MSQTEPLRVAQDLLGRLGSHAAPEVVAEMFSADLVWEIPGDTGCFPWIGKRIGRAAVVDFIRGTAALVERIRFDVHDILANGTRAVILGSLASKVNETCKVIETSFAIVLTVSSGTIVRFEMLEDSFAVSRAARAAPRDDVT
jgi:ketosteroid isomerase-like protein